jgi:hypothetical protein
VKSSHATQSILASGAGPPNALPDRHTSRYRDRMKSTADHVALRRCVLAVSVLADVDVLPSDDGARLPGASPVLIGWDEIAAAAGPDVESDVARVRVEDLLRLHALVAELGGAATERLRSAARVIALPAGHADHLGPAWVREHLRGGALELGVGVHGLITAPVRAANDPVRDGMDRVVPLHPGVATAAGIDTARWWPHLKRHADRMGALAAARLGQDGTVEGVIRPVGGCDVLALLASPSLRRHLATGDGTGLRALAVPMRRRGWYDLKRVDPAFVGAAWSATDELDRGVPRPLLVTADEVTLAAGVPRPQGA